MIKNFFKTAVRNLVRNRIYSIINILGLSLGLACALLIILYIKDEASYDKFHVHSKQLYRIFVQATAPDGRIQRMGITGGSQGPAFKAKIPEIAAFVRVGGGYGDIKQGTGINPQPLLMVDSNFFSVFSFPLLQGDPKTVLLDPNAIVLSEDAAKKYFGSRDAVGQTVLMRTSEQFVPYKVTGIAKRCPQNSSLQFDALISQKTDAATEQAGQNWFNFYLTTYVLLDPGANLQTTEKKMTTVYREAASEFIKKAEEQYHTKDKSGYMLQPFTDIHVSDNMDRYNISSASNIIYSYILSAIAFFILLIACINFINLTIARSLKRAKEIGIRKVIGSSRKQLIVQFLGESFVLCLIAFGLAIVIAQLLLPVFNRLSNKALSFSYLADLKLITGYLTLFFFTGLLSGFYPALVLSNYQPVHTLYNRFRLGGKNYLQKSLVVLQFALATFLIGATFIIFSQFNYLTTKKLGYDDSELVLVNKANLTRGESKLFRQELLKNANIVGFAAKDEGYSFNEAKINGDSGIGVANMTIDESFLPLLKIPIIKGRNFSKEFPSDSINAAIINETFVKKAGWNEPIGKTISFDGKRYRVVGVVKDYHYLPLNREIEPELFTMRMQQEFGMAFIKIKSKTETASMRHIEYTFKKLFPLYPFSFTFKNEENLKSYEAEAKWKQIMLFGAILTIFISCIGLFGLSVLAAEKRTKEIGIRKVLGASVNKIATILSKDFLKLVMISLAIAMPLSWLVANKWLENYPYRIHVSWWMFAAIGMIVVLIALATVSFQALRAGRMNPVNSLRSE